MRTPGRRLLFWSPRVLCILFAVFVSLFAFDVFGQGYGFWGTIFALLMHLIPTAVIVVALLISWRWERIGAVLFVALAVFYLVLAAGKFSWLTYITMSGPLFLVGVLFFINWRYRGNLREQG